MAGPSLRFPMASENRVCCNHKFQWLLRIMFFVCAHQAPISSTLNLTQHSISTPHLTSRRFPSPTMDNFSHGLATFEDKYTDCTIRFPNGATIRAHKIILHLRSPIFKAALDKRDEGEKSILDLKDEDTEALYAMLHFFYHDTYAVPESCSALVLHVRVHQVAYVSRKKHLACGLHIN